MKTVVLCGSARFEKGFKETMRELTLQGFVVIGMGSYPSENGDNKDWYDSTQKEVLDMVHFQKIMLADSVVVIDQDEFQPSLEPGYVGYSTAREILWAAMHDKIMVKLSSYDNYMDMAQDLVDEASSDDVLLAMAEKALTVKQGVEVFNHQLDDNKVSVMHAALSRISCMTGITMTTAAEFAGNTLMRLNMDPMDESEYMTTIGIAEVPEAPPPRRDAYSHADGSRECRPVEEQTDGQPSHLFCDPSEATHFVHSNGGAVLVKEAEFFRRSGGMTTEWGRRWRPIKIALSNDPIRDIENARAIGQQIFNVGR